MENIILVVILYRLLMTEDKMSAGAGKRRVRPYNNIPSFENLIEHSFIRYMKLERITLNLPTNGCAPKLKRRPLVREAAKRTRVTLEELQRS